MRVVLHNPCPLTLKHFAGTTPPPPPSHSLTHAQCAHTFNLPERSPAEMWQCSALGSFAVLPFSGCQTIVCRVKSRASQSHFGKTIACNVLFLSCVFFKVLNLPAVYEGRVQSTAAAAAEETRRVVGVEATGFSSGWRFYMKRTKTGTDFFLLLEEK